MFGHSHPLLHTFDVRYNSNRAGPKKCFLYYDATVECNTQEYSIFAAVAVCVLVIFIVFPTVLLIVYPTRLFRRCVSCCGFQRWHALHMYVESFQGQYKDGTNGTRDFRMVSAFFLILRILIVASFSPHRWSPWSTSELRGVLFVIVCSLYAILRPYRLNYRNNVDILTLALLTIFSLIFPISLYHFDTASPSWSALILILLIGVPHMILILFLGYKLAKIFGITHHLKRRYIDLKSWVVAVGYNFQTQAVREADSLPDRMINPGEYEPLLPPAKGQSTCQ